MPMVTRYGVNNLTPFVLRLVVWLPAPAVHSSSQGSDRHARYARAEAKRDEVLQITIKGCFLRKPLTKRRFQRNYKRLRASFASEGRPSNRREQMNERRRFSRHSTCLRGRVYFSDGRKSLPRLIRDVAYEGARIIIAHRGASVPNELDLYSPKRKRIAHASVRWRHGDKLGLALSEVRRHTGERRAPLRTPSAARRR